MVPRSAERWCAQVAEGVVRIRTDGASRGNPGPAGIGIVVEGSDGATLAEIAEYIDRQTNNVAEYTALVRGLTRALELGATSVDVFSDSELMVRQVEGRYEVKNDVLRTYAQQVRDLRRRFSAFHIQHVPRSQNRRADALANLAIDRAQGNGQR